MTRNQIAYREHAEQKRHNLADEAVRAYTASSEADLRSKQGLATEMNAQSQAIQAESSRRQAESANITAFSRVFGSVVSLFDTMLGGLGSIAKFASVLG